MQLDRDPCPELLGNHQMSTVNTYISIPLAELERVPVVRLLESGKPNPWTTISLAFVSVVQEELECLCQTVRDGLLGGGWCGCACRASKLLIKIVLVWERLSLFVLILSIGQHRVVRLTCFNQAVLQAVLLLLGWIQSVLKRSHTC